MSSLGADPTGAPVTEGTMTWDAGDTWYRVTGVLDPDAAQAPAGRAARRARRRARLHAGHDLAGRPTAAPSSTTTRSAAGAAPTCPTPTPRPGPSSCSSPSCAALVDHLGIAGRFHLLGQSWGGMLGPEVVLADAAGIVTLTICDSPASMPLWLEAAHQLRAAAARRRAGDAAAPRGGGHHRLRRVHRGDGRLLRPPRVPGAADAAGGRGQLRPDRGRADRLPHDERAE